MKKVLGLCIVLTAALSACKKDSGGGAEASLPIVSTSSLTNITASSATGGGTITSNGGSAITASGIVWSTSNNTPNLTDSVVAGTTTTGSFTQVINNLFNNTTYYIRAYATNAAGTGYGNVVTLSTLVDTNKVKFNYMGQLVEYGIIKSTQTGRVWMDRNLGASGVATSLTNTAGYGHLFQWGRLADGHQLRTSAMVEGTVNRDVPGHAIFLVPIVDNPSNADWRMPKNDNLWQGVNGINNPCPAGWRLATDNEWIAEEISDLNTGFARLKLTLAGYRERFNGRVGAVGIYGRYWTSSMEPYPDNVFGRANVFDLVPGYMGLGGSNRGNGFCVRCIKEL